MMSSNNSSATSIDFNEFEESVEPLETIQPEQKINVKVTLYCGQPGTGKSTLLRKLYRQYAQQKNIRQVILCPTNQLISTYQSIFMDQNQLEGGDNTKPLLVETLYKLLKLTPKTMPSKHLKNSDPLFKKTITIPNIIYIDEIFMFSFQEIWALLKCISIKQFIQRTTPYQVQLYMFGDPFQLKCCATSMAQQDNIKAGGDGRPIYWYHAFSDFKLTIETIYLKTLWRFDSAFSQYIISLKQMWKKEVSGDFRNNISYNNTDEKTQSIKLPFDVIDENKLGSLVSKGYVILVGTHRSQTYYQKRLFQYFRNSVIHAKDGKSYRMNGPVYRLSQLGGSYQNKCILKAYDDKTGNFLLYDETKKEDITVKPKKGQTIKYDIAPGDVLTVNVVQGRELPGVIIDMQSLFEFGSFYTAISRCKKIQDVKLITVSEIGYPDLQNDFVLKELLDDEI